MVGHFDFQDAVNIVGEAHFNAGLVLGDRADFHFNIPKIDVVFGIILFALVYANGNMGLVIAGVGI